MVTTACNDKVKSSFRILIGPLDEKAPEPFHCASSSCAPSIRSATPTREPSSPQEHTVRPAPPPQKNSLSQSSFMTANSEFAQASSPEWPERQLTTTASTSLTPPDATLLSPPDATFLMPRPVSPALSVSSSLPSTSTSSSSVATVRPPPTKPRRPLHSSLTRRLRKIKQYKQHVHRHHHRHHHDDLEDASTPPAPVVPLLWRKAGPVFTPHLPSSLRKDPGNPTTGVLKHDILLCAALMGFSREPSSYRAAQKMATRTDPWHQLEVLLTPNALDCYDSPGLIWPKRKRQYHVPLGDTSNPVTLGLSSPLDYSFYVHFGTGKDSLTLLFLARSKTLCQEWYLAIYRALPDDCKAPLPLACDVYVPSLDLRLHIPLVFDSDTSSSSDTDDNHSHTTATRAIDARYYVTAEQVKTAVVDLLEEDDLIRGKDMALCWIRGDRAEWIHWQYDMKHDARADLIMGPQIIEHTHQLQLRYTQHMPHKVVLNDRMELKEPPPVEGFLHRVSDFKGNMSAASRWRRNRLYFATFRSFLFYMSSGKASSPDPCTFVAPEHDLLGLGTHRSQPTPTSPYATTITPFAGSTHEISSEWQTAELRRRMNLIKNAKGYIDLTEIAYVRRAFADPDDGDSGDHAIYAGSAISSIAASSSTPLFHGQEASSSAHPRRQHGSLLELVMNNGLCIKLKAFDNSTCEQWVTCLSNLITYYKAHLEAERDVYCDQPNFTTPIDTPSQITSSPPEPKVDTRIWNLCIFEQCQDVAKSGILYMQRDQSVFSQRQFILTADGWLHYYNVYARSATTGEPEVTAVHERKSSFDLANAYVFSGWASRARHRGRAGGGGGGGAGGGRAALTGSGSDAWNDDRPSRLFANGLIATDANHECSFTLWFPKPRRVFSPKRQRILVYPTDQRFNAKGTRFHFLAANRQAKEEWVNVIKIVQEQLLREAMVPQNTDTDAS